MLLTDGWWGGSTENTSITSAWCHKTVKQNQSHIELAGSWCAHTGTHMHPQQAQSNPPITQDSQPRLSRVTRLSKFCQNNILNIHVNWSCFCLGLQQMFLMWTGFFFSLSKQFTLSLVYKQPTATMPQVFIWARDRRLWCSKTPNCYQCSSSLQQ